MSRLQHHYILSSQVILITLPGLVLTATRIPATGWTVFYCFNNNGILSHIHLDHAIINLQLT